MDSKVLSEGMFTVVKAVHILNAISSMYSAFFGIVTDTRDVHLLKAAFEISRPEFWNSTELNNVQPSNALSPILESHGGRVTDVSFVHSAKA